MPSQRIKGFVGQSYSLKNVQYDCQQSINWYPEVNETGNGKDFEIAQLVPSPGLYTAITGTGVGRARGTFLASNNQCYQIFGTSLYRINGVSGSKTSFTRTLLYSGLASGSDQAFFTDNGTNLFITVGGSVFTTVLATGATSQLTADGYSAGATSCTFINGRVVFTRSNSMQFYWTDLYSTTATNLDFTSADGNADHLVATISNNFDLIMFGKRTIEIWYYNGQNNDIFNRRTNILIETGCASGQTVKKLNNTVFWLGLDDRGGPMLQMFNGYSPQRMSTFAMEQEWANYSSTQIAAAQAFTWQEGGHHFYALNIPGADTTWVLDATASQQLGAPTWHERKSYNSSMVLGQWLAQGHSYFNGYHICGDQTNDNLYIMDPDTYTDAGRIQIHERTAPHLTNFMNRVRYDKLTLDFAAGTSSIIGLSPQIMLQFSDDGGHTWSAERWESPGAIGEFSTRIQYQQLGMARNRVFRIRVSDPIYWALSGASVTFQTSSH